MRLTRPEAQKALQQIWNLYCEQGYITQAQAVKESGLKMRFDRLASKFAQFGLRLPDIWSEGRYKAALAHQRLVDAGYSVENRPTMNQIAELFQTSYQQACNLHGQIVRHFPQQAIAVKPVYRLDDQDLILTIRTEKPDKQMLSAGHGHNTLKLKKNGYLVDFLTGKVYQRWLIM